ncbi:MAG: hypothetical protein O7C75_10775, partial [Verrucomicrobia bacterium]|nr:hypothetical protein [Verrucomicrobiota bacterium]
MTDNTSQTLPKWPFLAGDIILVLLACFIVIASPKPMTALTIFACALSVILGMLVFVTPYLIEHLTAQQTIKLKQVKAEETLLKAVDLASDLLNRTETIHAELMKSVLVSKQVPAKLEEKAEELADLLSSKENEEIISLKNEIETLKVLDSDKLAASVSKFGKLIDSLDSITPEQNSKSVIDRNELLKLFESQRADSRSNAE